MGELVIATYNKGKVREFQQLLTPLGFMVKSLADYPQLSDIAETGETFADNALLKARVTSQKLQKLSLADDSGLIVDALGGKPGIYSARYAGLAKDDAANRKKVLFELGHTKVSERTARFHCSLALVTKEGAQWITEGVVEGKILFAEEGTGGFGYDSIFVADELGKSFSLCSAEEKHSVSHRQRALQKMLTIIKQQLL